MLSLSELRRLVPVLAARWVGARVDKVVQSDPTDVVLHLSGADDAEGGHRRGLLLLCARPTTARISELPKPRKALPQPPGFAQYLKAHVDGARLRAVELFGEERQLRLFLETREARLSIVVSILGPRSNLYVLDREGRVVASARPLGETRRDLSMNAPWQHPEGGPPREGEERFAEVADDALPAAIETHYAGAEALRDEQQLASRLAKALRKRASQLEKKVRLLEGDLAAADRAPEWERQGELLKSRIREVRPGMSEISVPDFETGEPVVIALEPKLAPQKNLERLFSKARKAVKRSQKAAGELDLARERLEANAALRERLEGADTETLEELAAEPEIARLLERYFPAPRHVADAPRKKVWRVGKRELPTRLVPKRYRTQSGLEVWVGKNDEGNDVLTTRLARGNDLFFHLEGDPGSHVILRTEGQTPPPEDALLEAAELAVNFSKARRATRASVHIAAIKDVLEAQGREAGPRLRAPRPHPPAATQRRTPQDDPRQPARRLRLRAGSRHRAHLPIRPRWDSRPRSTT